MTFQVLSGRTDMLVQVFGTGMARSHELLALSNCSPEHLGTCLAQEGALAFQIVHRDVLTYRRDDGPEQVALSDPYDPSGIYYIRGFFLSETQRQGLFPDQQQMTVALLQAHDDVRFLVTPDGEGHRILPFWEGDILLEEISVPKHFPRAIDYIFFWPRGQERFGFQPEQGSLMSSV